MSILPDSAIRLNPMGLVAALAGIGLISVSTSSGAATGGGSVNRSKATGLSADLIVPRNSPVRLQHVDRQQLSAGFAGRVILSGRFTYGCADECTKPYPPAEMHLYFSPDQDMVARLPRWKGYQPPGTIEIDNASAFAALAVPRRIMRELQYGRREQVSGRAAVLLDHFRTGIACDAPWASARFLSLAQPAAIDTAASVRGAGCE